MVSNQVAAIGITVIPTPVTEQASDLFFVHQFGLWSISFASGSGITAPSASVYEIDSKAMRKVSDDQDVAIVVENEDSSFGCQIKVVFRMLLKLH